MLKKEDNKLDYKNVFQTMFDLPITKILLIGGGLLGLIFISGQIFRVVGSTVSHYKGMKEAINK